MVSGARGNAESGDSAKMYGSAGPPAAPTSLPTPPVTQPVSLLGTQGVAPGPVIGLQAPSTGLLGARPGLIPLQRPPGMPPPHLQRFPMMPPRPMPPHMMHRGPPPGPGGFAMPPPHGMKGPFPPHGPFVRPGGMPGLGGPGPGPGASEDRDGRQQQPQQQPPPQQQQQQQQPQQQPPQQSPSQQPAPAQQQPPQFRNDSRQQFNSGRDQERFGRRSFGSRVENDRERYGSRNDDRDNSNRERREWGRRSPDRDRHRDLEERSRRSSGHRDRDRDSRDRESRREKEENRKEKHEVADRAGGNKAVEPPLSQVGTIDTVSELNKGEAMATVVKPEESPAEVTSPVGPEKDPGSAAEPPR